jgi:D-alanyl-D-alanine-carboxypeptidase/D-alanyl-D-alanine-endopeptidase
LFVLLSAVCVQAADIQGAWDGTLDVGILGETRISIEIKGGSAAITSPDRTWRDIKATVSEGGGLTVLNAALIGAAFRGKLSPNGKTLVGSWTQGGRLRPLVLNRRKVGWAPAWPNLSRGHVSVETPSDAAIKAILRQRILLDHQGVGMIVGIVDRRRRRIIAFGRSDAFDPRPLDGATIFEIGSISKVFTSLLLEEAAGRGELTIDDPASRFALRGAAIPRAGDRQITLADLATHTSGLPDDDDLWDKDPVQPYARYDVSALFRLVRQAKLIHTPGKDYRYSNIGAALLGQLLAMRAGQPYGELVRARITFPLGMNATTLNSAAGARIAVGHDSALKSVAPFEARAFGPAGGLRSDADDMLTLLGAELGYVKTPLGPALRAQWSTVRRPAINPRVKVALGWHVTLRPEGQIVWHNGGTPGFRSFAGFNPKTGVGVVVLSNANTGVLGPDDIGLHLLDPAAPLDVAAPPAD